MDSTTPYSFVVVNVWTGTFVDVGSHKEVARADFVVDAKVSDENRRIEVGSLGTD